MASRKKQSLSLNQALDYVLDSDYNSELDSSTGGMSSGEEEELDKQLSTPSEINLEKVLYSKQILNLELYGRSVQIKM